ncbi:hypothetical protein HOY82DRAFT_632700 [Tuber indicum]|nr:hypothetical protein HOY82DRAFT_632700 [Tuber indicum]
MLGRLLSSFLFSFFFSIIVLGFIGSAIMSISRGVGGLLLELCLLFSGWSDLDVGEALGSEADEASSSGILPGGEFVSVESRLETSMGIMAQPRLSAVSRVLRWRLNHRPYLFDEPLESPDSGEYIAASDDEQSTVLSVFEAFSEGYETDAWSVSEEYPQDLSISSAILSSPGGLSDVCDSDAESCVIEERHRGSLLGASFPPLSSTSMLPPFSFGRLPSPHSIFRSSSPASSVPHSISISSPPDSTV